MLIPKNRHEYYLAVISGNDYPTFPPKTREELYLAKLAGREVDVPTPKTPKERAYYNIINDIKFDPENRWQTFVAAANDDSITAPIPRTREEIWWTNISLSREVIVEYVGTLPATLQTVEGYLESYKIYGNTEQNGTPTPENPIVPSGCGERTENLFDISTWYGVEVRRGNIEEVNNGFKITALSNDAYTITYGLPQYSYKVIPNEKYTLSWTVDNPKIDGYVYVFSGSTMGNNIIASVVASQQKLSFTVPSEHSYIAFRLGVSSSGNSITYTDIMLNLGPTALPYEPYGYKLPILSNGVEYPIYLGEVETTRRIKKLVLTGEEDIEIKSGKAKWYIPIADMKKPTNPSAVEWYCSHYQAVANSASWASYDYMISWSTADTGSSIGMRIRDIDFLTGVTVADFKSYLAAQYAAGTPVTVWYVLAEPETGIVNEPLMKIGDYADTIDSTQSTVQIPTAAGTTVIDYNGEPKPDKVELTYKTVKRAYISSDDEVYQDPNGQLLGG